MAPRLGTLLMQQRMCPVVARGRPHETSLGEAAVGSHAGWIHWCWGVFSMGGSCQNGTEGNIYPSHAHKNWKHGTYCNRIMSIHSHFWDMLHRSWWCFFFIIIIQAVDLIDTLPETMHGPMWLHNISTKLLAGHIEAGKYCVVQLKRAQAKRNSSSTVWIKQRNSCDLQSIFDVWMACFSSILFFAKRGLTLKQI